MACCIILALSNNPSRKGLARQVVSLSVLNLGMVVIAFPRRSKSRRPQDWAPVGSLSSSHQHMGPLEVAGKAYERLICRRRPGAVALRPVQWHVRRVWVLRSLPSTGQGGLHSPRNESVILPSGQGHCKPLACSTQTWTLYPRASRSTRATAHRSFNPNRCWYRVVSRMALRLAAGPAYRAHLPSQEPEARAAGQCGELYAFTETRDARQEGQSHTLRQSHSCPRTRASRRMKR